MALSRGARVILTFVLVAALVSMAGLATTLLVAGRGPSVERDSVLWLRVPGVLAERAPDDFVGQVLGGRETVGSIVAALRKAKVDERIAAVVLVPSFQPGLWGKVQEIRDAVLDFRESDKPIVAYLEFGQGQAYYLATACDEIFLTPSSPLNLVGVASYELFLREAFDRIGLEADMVAAGDYKTASNMYTETTFTSEHREMAASLNRDFYEQLVDGIAHGREMEPAVVRALIDDGPFLADEALSRGLVDAVVYEDQLLGGLPIPRNAGVVDLARYRQVRPIDVGIGGGPSIGVVFTEGTINFGTTGATVPTGQSVGSGDVGPLAPRGARRPGHRSDHPADRQPRGGGDRGGHHVARGGPGPHGEAGDRLDVRHGRLGRVLHRGPGSRHRGPAGHAHRIDWSFRRQVRARRSARPDRRERGGSQRRRPGGALLAGDDVQRGRSGARSSTSSTRPTSGSCTWWPRDAG